MLNIVIFGAPGSGKGTQSDFIVEKYGLTHLSTGDLLRAEIKAQSAIGKKAQVLIDAGNLVPDSLIIELLEKKILETPDSPGFIFDGFPRTVAQAEVLDSFLKEHQTKVSIMLNLHVDEQTLIDRLLNRGKTSGRADDNLETIQKRLNVYKTKTLPVLDYYRSSDRATTVDNNSTVEACFEHIVQAIQTVK